MGLQLLRSTDSAVYRFDMNSLSENLEFRIAPPGSTWTMRLLKALAAGSCARPGTGAFATRVMGDSIEVGCGVRPRVGSFGEALQGAPALHAEAPRP